jgi:hypothetical protein
MRCQGDLRRNESGQNVRGKFKGRMNSGAATAVERLAKPVLMSECALDLSIA